MSTSTTSTSRSSATGRSARRSAALLGAPRPPRRRLRALRRACTTCRAPSTSTTRSCRSGSRSGSPSELDVLPIDDLRVVRRRRRADPAHGASRRSARRAGSPATRSTSRRSSGRSTGRVRALPTADGPLRLERRGARAGRRPRRADAAPRARAACRRSSSRPTRRATVRARYVIGADGANSFVRAGGRHRVRGPGLRGALARRRPAARRRRRARPRSRRRASGATRRGRTCTRATAARTGASSSCCCPASVPRTSPTSARVWELLAPWFTPADGDAGAPGGLRVPRPARRDDARRPRAAGRRRRAHDAAVHGPGAVLGRARRREPRVAAGPRSCAGSPSDALLDGYTAERRPQNEWIVNLSTEMGRVSCTLDPQAAAERDAALRAADAPPPLALPPLQEGTLAAGRPLAGHRAVQGVVRARPPRGPLRRRLRQALRAAHPPAACPARPSTSSSWSASAPHAIALRPARGPRRPADRLVRRAPRSRPSLVRPDAYVFGAAECARRGARAGRRPARPPVHHRIEDHRRCPLTGHPPQVPPRQLQDHAPAGDDRLVLDRRRQPRSCSSTRSAPGLSNDAANHRIALTAFPNFVDDPEKDTRTGLHHTAFEYDSFEAAQRELPAAQGRPGSCRTSASITA